MKKISIIQSNYIPWRGYFDIMNYSHEFVLYDNVQFTKNDWRNRNKIIHNGQPRWLTIPVTHKFGQSIYDVKVASLDWSKNHWGFISQSYRKAKYYKEISSWLELIYLENDLVDLSSINKKFIIHLCNYLEISTVILDGRNFATKSLCKTQRLIDICISRNADCYVTGPSALSYLNMKLFHIHGIKLEIFSYDKYQNHRQQSLVFNKFVSAVDLLFNEGKDSRLFLNANIG